MRTRLLSLACVALFGCAAHRPPRPPTVGYAEVNGLRMYYELHGPEGRVPLVLLHGGGSTIEVTWGRILPLLARSRRIIAIEEQGHGRTSDREGPVSFETSADDVAALLRQLGVDRADVFGFSNGANVALQVAVRHPPVVRRLIFASSFTRRSGAPPEFWDFIGRADFSMMPQALKDAFLKVTPDPARLRTMHDKDAERMRTFVDVPDEQLRAVTAPTLILLGDRDVVTPKHAVELTAQLSRARLIVLPGGHGEYLGELVMTSRPSGLQEVTATLVDHFLDEPSPGDRGALLPE